MIGVKRLEGGTKFVVLSSQRSGSTWLVSLLNQVEGARAYGELFLKRKKTGVEDHWDEDLNYPHFPEAYARSKQIRPRAVFSFLDALFCQPEAVGLKLMYTQLQKYPEIMAYLLVHRVRVVHLVRQNQVDVLISRAIKNKIRRAHVMSGDDLPEDIRVEINPQKFVGRLERRQKKIETARRLLRWSTLPHLEVTYENLLKDTSFLRIHKSFLINLHHVREYQRGEGGMVIMSDNAEIEVSRRKKDQFLVKIKEAFRY
jgi:LPS sulfotransferase NodH